MNVALDIDGTITQRPDFFAVLADAIRSSDGEVYIVTSRGNAPAVAAETRRELAAHGIEFDELIIIPEAAEDRIACPHADLDWYQQYLWQKVSVCVARDVDIVFEDDAKVIDLFRRFAPQIQVFEVK